MTQLNNINSSLAASIHGEARRARTRSLIQIGGLVEALGLSDLFFIKLGSDLQKDVAMKTPMATLAGALLLIKDMVQNDEVSFALLQERGLKFLAYLNEQRDLE